MTKFKKLWKYGDNPVMDRRRLQDVLAGDVSGLMSGLGWTRTPQGPSHWSQIFSGEKKLSKRSRFYLNKLLSA